MSLKQIYPSEQTETHTGPIATPIVLVPGILGNTSEVNFLAQEIDKNLNHSQPIYVYTDESLNTDDQPLDIDAQVNSLLADLKLLPTFTPYTFILVGYSYGSMLGVFAALKLAKEGHHPHVFVIDGMAPQLSQHYYKSQTEQAVQDIISILNYSAMLSNLNPIQFRPQEVMQLRNKKFEDQFDAIKKKILNSNTHSSTDELERFKAHAQNARMRLDSLLQDTLKLPQDNIKLKNINILLTNETTEKYRTNDGGWTDYTCKLNSMSELVELKEKLVSKKHGELLNEKNCKHLADLITYSIKNEINLQQVFQDALAFQLKELQEQYPEIDVRQAVQGYCAASPPLASPPANDVELIEMREEEVQPSNTAQPTPVKDTKNCSTFSKQAEDTSLDDHKKRKNPKQQFGFFAEDGKHETRNSRRHKNRQMKHQQSYTASEYRPR